MWAGALSCLLPRLLQAKKMPECAIPVNIHVHCHNMLLFLGRLPFPSVAVEAFLPSSSLLLHFHHALEQLLLFHYAFLCCPSILLEMEVTKLLSWFGAEPGLSRRVLWSKAYVVLLVKKEKKKGLGKCYILAFFFFFHLQRRYIKPYFLNLTRANKR